MGTVHPFSGDQSRDGRKSLQEATYDLPSPSGGSGSSICRHNNHNRINLKTQNSRFYAILIIIVMTSNNDKSVHSNRKAELGIGKLQSSSLTCTSQK